MSEVKGLVQEKPGVQKEPPSEIIENREEDSEANSSMEVAFDQSKIQEVLDKVIQEFKEMGNNMEISVIRQPFEIRGEKIIFLLNGEIQKDIFVKLRPELTGRLRRFLQNRNVEVSFQINPQPVSTASKLYTSTDKLLYLREKSPALKELQKRFGLETDF